MHIINIISIPFINIGKDDNDEHSLNMPPILITLIVFNLEISGKDNNDEHPLNITHKRNIISIPF